MSLKFTPPLSVSDVEFPVNKMWYVGSTAEKMHVDARVLKGALVPEFRQSSNKGRTPKSQKIREAERQGEEEIAAIAAEAERVAELNEKRLAALQEQYGEEEGERMAAAQETEAPIVPPVPPPLSDATVTVIDQAEDLLHDSMLIAGGGGPLNLKSQLMRLEKAMWRSRRHGRDHAEAGGSGPCAQPPSAAAIAATPIAGLAVALYDFEPADASELGFGCGDMLSILAVAREATPEGWLYAMNAVGSGVGLVPESHVDLKVRRPVEAVDVASLDASSSRAAAAPGTDEPDAQRDASRSPRSGRPRSRSPRFGDSRPAWKSSWHAQSTSIYRR